QRIAAEFEEVVINTNVITMKQFVPNISDLELKWRVGRRHSSGATNYDLRKFPPCTLSGDSFRQLRHHQHVLWDLKRCQMIGKKCFDVRGWRIRSRLQDNCRRYIFAQARMRN